MESTTRIHLYEGYMYINSSEIRQKSLYWMKLMINGQERVEAYSRNSMYSAGKQNGDETRTNVHKRQDKFEIKV